MNYLLRTLKDQWASVFNPSISILSLMILTAILMPKQVSQLMSTKMKCRNGQVARESNLTPSCLGLNPIGAHPYMWMATFGALYTPWLFRAIIRIILLMVGVWLWIFFWGYTQHQWFNSPTCMDLKVQNFASAFIN